MHETAQYFEKWFTRQVLDFHSQSKFYATYQNYEILLKSLVPNVHYIGIKYYRDCVVKF